MAAKNTITSQKNQLLMALKMPVKRLLLGLLEYGLLLAASWLIYRL